jgi:hypothetical protein
MDDPDLTSAPVDITMDLTSAPVGITVVVYDNGDVEPVVEVVYRGRDGRGIARWRAGVVPDGRKVVSLSVAHLPAKTGVELVSMNGEELA